MNLKDFVKQAIIDVVQGVEAAQTELGSDYAIGTSSHNRIASLPPQVVQDHNGAIYAVVAFDIAVTTSDEAKGSGGISVLSFGAKAELAGRSETASRVSFSTIARMT